MDRADSFSLTTLDLLNNSSIINFNVTRLNSVVDDDTDNQSNSTLNANISFDTSSVSAFSGEEEVIQQRGRKILSSTVHLTQNDDTNSPKRQTVNPNNNNQLQKQTKSHLANISNNIQDKDLFAKLKQKYILSSPNSKSSKSQELSGESSQELSTDISQLSSFGSSVYNSPKKCKRNLNESLKSNKSCLLRTPIRKRLLGPIRGASTGRVKRRIRYY